MANAIDKAVVNLNEALQDISIPKERAAVIRALKRLHREVNAELGAIRPGGRRGPPWVLIPPWVE
ncbi:MAG: hypothetical protein NVSMB23_12750 [Myxococcales bacterium]